MNHSVCTEPIPTADFPPVKENQSQQPSSRSSSLEDPPGKTLRLCNISNTYLNEDLVKMVDDCSTGSPVSVTSFVQNSLLGPLKQSLGLIEPISDDDDTTIATSVTPEPPKRVHFRVDDAGEIEEELSAQSISALELTPDIIAELWYSRAERRAFKEAVHDKCRMQSSATYRRAALKVCALAARPDFEGPLSDDRYYRDAVAVIVNPEVRGMERPLFQTLMLPRRSSRLHVQSVLRTQEILKEGYAGDGGNSTAAYSFEEMEAIIAANYSKRTNYAIRFALILGMGDIEDLPRLCL